ncbi:MAG: hypothetical protein QM811_25590 [Pirellulales bacterium]
MPRTVSDILREIEGFQPVDDDWRPLDVLLNELWSSGVPEAALPTLFGVFERYPDFDGAGVFWSILHGVEGLEIDYEQALRDSLARRSSEMGKVMLARLERECLN